MKRLFYRASNFFSLIISLKDFIKKNKNRSIKKIKVYFFKYFKILKEKPNPTRDCVENILESSLFTLYSYSSYYLVELIDIIIF